MPKNRLLFHQNGGGYVPSFHSWGPVWIPKYPFNVSFYNPTTIAGHKAHLSIRWSRFFWVYESKSDHDMALWYKMDMSDFFNLLKCWDVVIDGELHWLSLSDFIILAEYDDLRCWRMYLPDFLVNIVLAEQIDLIINIINLERTRISCKVNTDFHP